MKKILYDRLPDILLELYTEEEWEGYTTKIQKTLLLNAHEKMLNDNSYVVKLLTEMEQE